MIAAAVEKPAAEDELVDLRFGHLLKLGLGREAVLERLLPDARGVQAAAIVRDLDDDVPALVIGGETDRALLGLPGGTALLRGLKAVVRRIAHHVRERILDQVEHLPVELGVGTVHLQLDVLVQLARKIANDARQLLPGIADRLHARLHDAFLQFGGDVRKALQRNLELGIVVPARDLKKLVAREHQLRDHRHQRLERVDVHADRLVGDLGVELLFVVGLAFGLGGFRCCFCCCCGLRLRRFRLRRDRRDDLNRRLAERTLQFVERDFARAQRTLQRLRDQRAGCRGLCGLRLLLRHCRDRGRHALQIADQVLVVAFRLQFVLFEPAKHFLQAVDGRQDERDGIAGDRHAIAEFAHQGFGGVRQRFEPRQPEESAGALDGVNEAENVVEDLGVVRLLLEPDEFDIDRVEALVRLGQELAQQVVHRGNDLRRQERPVRPLPFGAGSVSCESV